MAFAVRGQLEGADALKKALAGVDERVRKKALKKGVNAASGVVLAKAKGKVRVRTRVLKKSLGRKLKVYRNGTVVGIIGPRTGRKVQVGTVRTGPNAGQPIYEDPSNIAHLVELGTHRSRAYPFMRPALEESRGEASSAVAEAVAAELHK